MLGGVSIDSRTVRPGDLFLCLPGERVDGHDYIHQAVARGARAVMAQRPITDIPVPVIMVDNCELALGEIASLWRKKTRAKVICITGTAGKTTVKNMLAAILSESGKLAATRGNQNNQIGLPLSILASDGDEEFLLLEAGISHEGDMDYLGRISSPNVATVINVGPGHTEGLGSRGVAWHKARLFKYLRPCGTGLVNGEYPELVEQCSKYISRPVLFGRGQNDYRFRACLHPGIFQIELAGKICTFETGFTSEFEWENVLAATATAHAAGIPTEKIQAGLEKAELAPHRNSTHRFGNFHIIDATYNANPLSMERNIRDAASKASGLGLPLILVLGSMGELGPEAPRFHFELGKLIAGSGARALLWTGNWRDDVISGIRSQNNSHSDPLFFDLASPEFFSEQWREISATFPAGAVILFKGSRANELDRHVSVWLEYMQGQIEIQEKGNVL